MGKSQKNDPVQDSRRMSRRLRPIRGLNRSDIARRAYALYLSRECEHGHDVDDWLRAERELREITGSAV
jgi:Protein of unknown function (DUF2934)